MMGWCDRFLCGGGGSQDQLQWEEGLKPHASGDYSIAVVQANSTLEDQASVAASPSSTLVGVFDGHGGPEASRFVNERLIACIQRFASDCGGLSEEVLRKAFRTTEEEFLSLVKEEAAIRPHIATTGSCCLVAAVEGGTLYVANLGDSRAVLGRRCRYAGGNRVVAERLSKDHNVAEEEVRRELQRLHPDDPVIVTKNHGVWRIKGIIQVSRSIGDVYLKRPNVGRNFNFLQQIPSSCPVPLKRPVLNAVPSINSRCLHFDDQFVILASDGLWEHLPDQAAVDIVANNPRRGIAMRLVRAAMCMAGRKKHTEYTSIKKMPRGVRRAYHDDITAVVVFFDLSKHDERGRRRTASTVTPIDVYSAAGQLVG